MKKEILPFLRCGKENRPSGMPCIALLSGTLNRELMSTWRKEFHAVQKCLYRWCPCLYSLGQSSSVRTFSPIYKQNKALCHRVPSCVLMSFTRAFDLMAAGTHVALHPKSLDLHVMQFVAFLMFPSCSFKILFSPGHSFQGHATALNVPMLNNSSIYRYWADLRYTVRLY